MNAQSLLKKSVVNRQTPAAHLREKLPVKTNPKGFTGEAAHHRRMELVDLRVSLREHLQGRSGNPLERLGQFAPVYVRGDFTPTISEAYWSAVDLINAERHNGQPEQLTLPLQRRLKLRVTVEAFNEQTQQWEKIQ